MCIFAGYKVTSEDETTIIETDFIGYTTSKNDLYLSTNAGETYTILFHNYYNGRFDNPASLCDGNSYTIWVTGRGIINAMSDSTGRQIITFESEREAYRNSQRMAVVSLSVALFLNISYFVLSLVVSKRSEWYPEWFVKLLFAHPSDFLS